MLNKDLIEVLKIKDINQVLEEVIVVVHIVKKIHLIHIQIVKIIVMMLKVRNQNLIQEVEKLSYKRTYKIYHKRNLRKIRRIEVKRRSNYNNSF
jgi:hypothetical protein